MTKQYFIVVTIISIFITAAFSSQVNAKTETDAKHLEPFGQAELGNGSDVRVEEFKVDLPEMDTGCKDGEEGDTVQTIICENGVMCVIRQTVKCENGKFILFIDATCTNFLPEGMCP